MKGRFIMTKNFEQNLTQAMKEVLESIDPNYTFDKEHNCYIAHDKERNDSIIMFAYEKPKASPFGPGFASMVTASTKTFSDDAFVASTANLDTLHKIVLNPMRHIRNMETIKQLIIETFPELQNPQFTNDPQHDTTHIHVKSDNLAPFIVSINTSELEYAIIPEQLTDISILFYDYNRNEYSTDRIIAFGRTDYSEHLEEFYENYSPEARFTTIENPTSLTEPTVKEVLRQTFQQHYNECTPEQHQLLHDFHEIDFDNSVDRDIHVEISPTLLTDPTKEESEPCLYLTVSPLDNEYSVNFYLAKRDNNIELIENDYGYHTARTFSIENHNNSVPETLEYMLYELDSDILGMAPRHVTEIDPFLKPEVKSDTHITSMHQLFEPDEFFVLDKKSDYTELIKDRLPQEEPDNEDDLDLPF
jgi:hypothetical protein